MEQKSAKPPTLKSLPSTDEAVELNIKQTHFVSVKWKSCTRGILPELDPCDYEWEKDGDSLRPTMLPLGTRKGFANNTL